MQIVIDARLDTDVWTLDEVLPGTAITLQFLEGELVGFSGCNTYAGAYTAAPNEDGTYAVTVSNLSLTQISCPERVMEQEEDYLEALQATTTASIQGNILVLAGAQGELILYQVGTPRPP